MKKKKTEPKNNGPAKGDEYDVFAVVRIEANPDETRLLVGTTHTTAEGSWRLFNDLPLHERIAGICVVKKFTAIQQ